MFLAIMRKITQNHEYLITNIDGRIEGASECMLNILDQSKNGSITFFSDICPEYKEILKLFKS